jgi:hypothetical protein
MSGVRHRHAIAPVADHKVDVSLVVPFVYAAADSRPNGDFRVNFFDICFTATNTCEDKQYDRKQFHCPLIIQEKYENPL